ncbi:MAG: hypothetical protein NTV61_05545 [Candidatus Bathyarchaeota archaeon]|nr:hypothetical protein [Candidatus Bathyarchaeota archaeon]
MADETRRRKIIKALNHDFRKRVLESVAKGSITYTDLLRLTGVESGYLAYHLKNMGDLLEKGKEGYTLTPLGLEAYSLLYGRLETPRRPITLPRVAAATLLAIILISTLNLAYTISVTKSANERRESNRLTLRNHTVEMMEAIVNAFEYVDVPRSLWTDILIHSTLLQKDLEVMRAENDPLTPTQLIPSVNELISEAARTLSSSDSAYLALSRENRQLLRDIYDDLFALKKSLV